MKTTSGRRTALTGALLWGAKLLLAANLLAQGSADPYSTGALENNSGDLDTLAKPMEENVEPRGVTSYPDVPIESRFTAGQPGGWRQPVSPLESTVSPYDAGGGNATGGNLYTLPKPMEVIVEPRGVTSYPDIPLESRFTAVQPGAPNQSVTTPPSMNRSPYDSGGPSFYSSH